VGHQKNWSIVENLKQGSYTAFNLACSRFYAIQSCPLLSRSDFHKCQNMEASKNLESLEQSDTDVSGSR
jgi:hypothetical protein